MNISIIIPALNEEKTIEKLLKRLVSIKKSKTNCIQIIVVDNNSIDRTVEIVRQFPEVVLLHEPRTGTSFARQKGLEAATGDIIACIDADCIPKRNWIVYAVSHFKKPEVLSVAGLCEFDNEYKFSWVPNLLQKIFFPVLHVIFSKIFKNGGMMLAGNVFFRKSALLAVGGFPTETKFWGDDAILAKKINQLPGIMVYDTDVAVITSSRRYAHTGVIKTLKNYIKNWILVFFGKIPNQESSQIR